MPTPPRRLPLLVERSVREVETAKIDAASKFELSTKQILSEEKVVITCRPGCAYCCYHPIMISILEAVPLYNHLQKRGMWTDALRKRLKETSDLQYGASFETWLYANIPCPLLDTTTKKCTAYAARPLICRAYLATSDPENCHPHRLGEDTRILDRSSVVDGYHKVQEKVLHRHKLQFLTVPIGKALLLAEKVATGVLDLEGIDIEILKEYVEKALCPTN